MCQEALEVHRGCNHRLHRRTRRCYPPGRRERCTGRVIVGRYWSQQDFCDRCIRQDRHLRADNDIPQRIYTDVPVGHIPPDYLPIDVGGYYPYMPFGEAETIDRDDDTVIIDVVAPENPAPPPPVAPLPPTAPPPPPPPPPPPTPPQTPEYARINRGWERWSRRDSVAPPPPPPPVTPAAPTVDLPHLVYYTWGLPEWHWVTGCPTAPNPLRNNWGSISAPEPLPNPWGAISAPPPPPPPLSNPWGPISAGGDGSKSTLKDHWREISAGGGEGPGGPTSMSDPWASISAGGKSTLTDGWASVSA